MTVQDGDVIRATAVMQLHGTDDQMNVFHVQIDSEGPASDEDVQAEIGTWLEAIYTCILSHLLNSVQFIEIQHYNVTQDVPMTTTNWPSLTFGSLDADDLPWGVSALVSMKTAAKRVGGRKYFGGLATSDIADGGTWVTGLATLFACVLLKMVGNQGGTNVDMYPGVWSEGTALWHPFTEASFDYVPAYQRRRRPGTGS